MADDITGIYVLLTVVVLIVLIAVAAVYMNMNPLNTPKGMGFELATKIAMYTDALSYVDKGEAIIEAGSNRFDIQLCNMDSTWTVIKESVVNIFRDAYRTRKGFYVTVVPYDKDGKKLDDSATAFIIRSYVNVDGCAATLIQATKVCIKKEPGRLAEVSKC